MNNRVVKISGTRLRNRSLVASLGTESLDSLFGGGVPNGALVVIDEVESRKFFGPIARCFIAEGFSSSHSVFAASANATDVDTMLNNIPDLNHSSTISERTESSPSSSSEQTDADFRIAWRYSTLPKVDSSMGISAGGSTKFNLSKKSAKFNIEALKGKDNLILFHPKACLPTLDELWTQLCPEMRKEEFSTDLGKRFLRIMIDGLSSPLWSDAENIPSFLAHLKALCRNAYCMALISVDSQLLDPDICDDILRLSDAFIRLEYLSEDEQKAMETQQKFDGRLYVHKLSTIDAISPHRPDCMDLIFTLKRQYFDVKIFHLPAVMGGETAGGAATGRPSCQRVEKEF